MRILVRFGETGEDQVEGGEVGGRAHFYRNGAEEGRIAPAVLGEFADPVATTALWRAAAEGRATFGFDFDETRIAYTRALLVGVACVETDSAAEAALEDAERGAPAGSGERDFLVIFGMTLARHGPACGNFERVFGEREDAATSNGLTFHRWAGREVTGGRHATDGRAVGTDFGFHGAGDAGIGREGCYWTS